MASYRYERNIRPEDLVQEPPRVLTPKERRANWWHYHWYYVALILAALLAAGWYAWQNLTAVRPDYVVTVVSRTDPAPELLEQVQAQLEAVGDVRLFPLSGRGRPPARRRGADRGLCPAGRRHPSGRAGPAAGRHVVPGPPHHRRGGGFARSGAGRPLVVGPNRRPLNQASLSSLQRPSVRPHPAARRGLFVQSPPSNVRTKGRQTRADRAVRQPLCLLPRQGVQNPPPLPRQDSRPGRTNKKAARPFGLTAFFGAMEGTRTPGLLIRRNQKGYFVHLPRVRRIEILYKISSFSELMFLASFA